MAIPDGSALPDVSGETTLTVGLISGSHLLNHMYLILLPPIFGLLSEEFGVGLTALGIAVGIQGAFNMAFQIPFGYLSDNYNRALTLGLGLSIGSTAVVVLALSPSSTFWMVYVSQALLGIGIAAHHPAHFPMLSDVTTEHNRGRVYSLHGFAGNIGYAIAPAVITGVLLVPGTTWRHAFLFIGFLGGAYAVVATLLLQRSVSDEVTRPSSDQQTGRSAPALQERIVGELSSLIASPAILTLGLLALFTSMASWVFRSYTVVLLTDGYGISLSAANTAFTIMFVVSAVLILAGGDLSDRISSVPILLINYTVVFVAASAVATFFAPAIVAIVLVLIGGSANSFGQPAREKLTDLLSARGDLGKNFAIITVGITLGGSIAPPLFGAIIDTFGYPAAFYAVGVLGLVGGTLAVAIFHHHRSTLSAGRPTAEDGESSNPGR